ncbi:aspartyl protease family protein 1-like isoform X2 [Momordica charantia]|uniref:Aspartyl protease family protein 1-like isoform X2 n=1 Tax=Momordica charantia TaxID=3673 RepID=A0A6J1D5P8_MOMCH|nr:aspartyl protease family protein 1-like isoform X2 [Momordica charantia]
MALQSNLLPAIAFHFILLMHSTFSADPIAANLLLTPPHRAMVLPLYLSSPNSSRLISKPRRHLRESNSYNLSNARMRLYDDLLLNGYLGMCCSWYLNFYFYQDPKFDPDLSSTFRPVKCNLDCSCDDDGLLCVYERQYAEMSTSSGILGEDIISFGNQSELVPQRATFGCETVETGDLYSQRADGIMGLGSGELSIVDQLVEKGVINDTFSLCYGGMDIGGGAMVLGGISTPSDMAFSFSDRMRSPYYNVDLKEIRVAGKKLLLNPSVFDGKFGTVLDSGTTYAYLPQPAFGAFKDAIMDEVHSLKKIGGPDPNFNDICFSGAGSDVAELSKTFPAVDMVFENGQKLSLAPENYLFRHSKVHGAYCLGIFENGNDQTTLLGGIIVRNTLVMYDRENSKIGFWKTNCSELWERLHISNDTAHAPSVSNTSHDTEMAPASAPSEAPASAPSEAPASAPSEAPASAPSEAPATAPSEAPASAPSEAPHYMIPGELQVGRITFEILLNISYEDLEPHITELSDLIAQELNVSYSQVRLLNFTMQGNDSLIQLAIIPGGSSEFFSHATATTIIAQIVEHHMQLPPTFGSYQVVQWNVEPLIKRSLWKQLYVMVIVAVIVTLLLGLSALGVWLIWRRRHQSFNSYKPVNAAAPEQELQPL